ncbi:uncharacterized protein LOC143286345 [Babylonia areolata]|uniref:uncharacterized protein LOC143286345 n=1 Tax=Babylonia areolata TaxID=304850 RepID=UPI003FD092CE
MGGVHEEDQIYEQPKHQNSGHDFRIIVFMGPCLGKRYETKEVSKRFLVDDSHFVAVTVARKAKAHASKLKHKEDAPLPVWVSRGMPHDRPELTDLQKRIVLESWVFLRPNMLKIGQIAFNEMVAVTPLLAKMFNKYEILEKNEENEKKQAYMCRRGRYQVIKSHVDKVMITLDKLLSVLNDPQRFEFLLHELGDRHAERTIRIEFLDIMIPCYIMAIHPALTDKWASNIEDAWAAFFRHILHIMKESIVF